MSELSVSRAQAIVSVLSARNFFDENNAIASFELAMAAYKSYPTIFTTKPTPSTAAAMLTNLFRETPEIHRVQEGLKYFYFYDANRKSKRAIQQRKARVNTEQEELFVPPVKKPAVQKLETIKLRSPDKSKLVEWPGAAVCGAAPLEVEPATQAPSEKYRHIKTPQGEFAGVLKGNILFTSLDQLVDHLNGQTT